MSLVTGFEEFHDDPEAPYYRSQRRSLGPAETWAAIHERLTKVLVAIDQESQRDPVRIDHERVCAWHRAIFGRDFVSAGELRRTDTWFGVADPASGTRMLRGTSPADIKEDLRDACHEYRGHISRLVEVGARSSLRDACEVAVRLYARVLAIHPFEDGNARAAYVVLQAALRSQGVRWVHFGGGIREHDRCLGAALVRDRAPDYGPLTDLLVERIRTAAANPGRDTI